MNLLKRSHYWITCKLEKTRLYAWITRYSYCVCVERITLCNCLCSFSSSCFSASRVRNIGASHILEFRPCHNLKSHVCWDFLTPSWNGFGHFKEELKHQARVILEKKLFVILCCGVRKLKELSILLLLITNYSSVYSIYLIFLSICLTILLVVGVSYQRVPCLAEGYS